MVPTSTAWVSTIALLVLAIHAAMAAPLANTTDGNDDVLELRAAADPPKTWQEHWFGHNDLVQRKFVDGNVAVYFEKGVSDKMTWPFSFLAKVWSYTKRKYGSFGDDQRLFAIYHNNKYSYSHPAKYFEADHDYRNLIDIGWTSGNFNDFDESTHEVAHIVEGATRNVMGSPSYPIWGDSKWAEIFNYDVYMGIGRKDDAKRWYDQKIKTSDSFPRANTFWFRDWFYPIYSKYGKVAVLNNYFVLLSKNFPTKTSWNGRVNYKEYTRELNFGEFVHFWSGAAKTDLTSLARKAFGDKDKSGNDWLKQLQKAKKDFSKVTYSKKN